MQGINWICLSPSIERRSVTSRYHSSKFLILTDLSWQRWLFALSNDGRKAWANVLFLSAIMHRNKVIHVNFFSFFCLICRTTICWDPEFFATMTTWRNDFCSLFPKAIKCFHWRGQHLCKFIGTKERVCITKKRVQLREDWFGTPTWPPFYCFWTPIWPPWRHVKTLYSDRVYAILMYWFQC